MAKNLSISGAEFQSKQTYSKTGLQSAKQMNSVGDSLNNLSGGSNINFTKDLSGGLSFESKSYPWKNQSFGYEIGYYSSSSTKKEMDMVTIFDGKVFLNKAYGLSADTDCVGIWGYPSNNVAPEGATFNSGIELDWKTEAIKVYANASPEQKFRTLFCLQIVKHDGSYYLYLNTHIIYTNPVTNIETGYPEDQAGVRNYFLYEFVLYDDEAILYKTYHAGGDIYLEIFDDFLTADDPDNGEDGGNMPGGTYQGEMLYWDITLKKWISTNEPTGPAVMTYAEGDAKWVTVPIKYQGIYSNGTKMIADWVRAH